MIFVQPHAHTSIATFPAGSPRPPPTTCAEPASPRAAAAASKPAPRVTFWRRPITRSAEHENSAGARGREAAAPRGRLFRIIEHARRAATRRRLRHRRHGGVARPRLRSAAAATLTSATRAPTPSQRRRRRSTSTCRGPLRLNAAVQPPLPPPTEVAEITATTNSYNPLHVTHIHRRRSPAASSRRRACQGSTPRRPGVADVTILRNGLSIGHGGSDGPRSRAHASPPNGAAVAVLRDAGAAAALACSPPSRTSTTTGVSRSRRPSCRRRSPSSRRACTCGPVAAA